jgi:hypothetical protein
VVAAWRTSDRATRYLIERLPSAIWTREVPGLPRRTVGMIAAHIHNSRCGWIRALGARHGVEAGLASVLALQVWWILALVLLLEPITIVRALREERVLRAAFGEEYERYRKRTWF